MKRLFISITCIIAIFSCVFGCSSKPQQNLDKEKIKMSSSISYWYNWYDNVEELVGRVDCVFEGTVTDVKFEIFDSHSAETVVSDMAEPFLFTMYKIEIEKVYKGNLNKDSSVRKRFVKT